MMTSLRSCTRYPSGGTPPIHIPFFFEAAILSRMRPPMTSRSNCAKDNRTLRVKRPIELVVLNCCDPRDAASYLARAPAIGRIALRPAIVSVPGLRQRRITLEVRGLELTPAAADGRCAAR